MKTLPLVKVKEFNFILLLCLLGWGIPLRSASLGNGGFINSTCSTVKDQRVFVRSLMDSLPPPLLLTDEVFSVVEDPPRFPGCEGITNKKERDNCAQQKMLEFIYINIKYPAAAVTKKVQGIAVIRFVVDKDGSLKDIHIVRNPGEQLGEEARRVVEMMNDMPDRWIPGKQHGKPVKVYFNIPVKFKLQ